MDDITITETIDVIKDIKEAIDNKRAFSLLRFCDGFLKIGNDIINDKQDVLTLQHRKEGIPMEFFDELMKRWVVDANEADYIDAPRHYLVDRIMSKRMYRTSSSLQELIRNWDKIYSHFGIDLDRKFCSPEAGYLSFMEGKENLLDVIHGKNICCITNYYEVEKKLYPFVNSITVKLIPYFYGNHYEVSFDSIMNEIKEEINKYDAWLVGAGELGRLYTGEIKRNGGVAVDIGKVFDAWAIEYIDSRMKDVLSISQDNKLLFCIKE